MKLLPVGAMLLRVDGRTDITKLIVAFSQFSEPPKNCYLLKSFVIDLRMLRNLHTFRLLYNIIVRAIFFFAQTEHKCRHAAFSVL